MSKIEKKCEETKLSEYRKMLLGEYEDEIIKDYRTAIVSNKRDQEWKNWKNWNILYRTLAYQLSGSESVEKYDYVMCDAFSRYCPLYKEEYPTADIMNGWWYCFKNLFGFDSREDKEAIESMRDACSGMEENDMLNFLVGRLHGKYKNKWDANKINIVKSFIRLLKVVYTTGNMTPSPVNPSSDDLDSWEYKLGVYKCIYRDNNGDVSKLHFEDYCKDGSFKPTPTTEDFENNPANYMNERVELILKRGYRIVTGREIDKNSLDKLIDKIDKEKESDNMSNIESGE